MGSIAPSRVVAMTKAVATHLFVIRRLLIHA